MILAGAQSAPVTMWPQRLALTLVMLVVIGLSCWAMWRSWRKRAERDADLVLADPPADPGPVLATAAGSYFGTSPAEAWMRRITAAGLGAVGRAEATVTAAGVLLERVGEPPLFLAAADLVGAGAGRGVAGEVAERDSLVLWQWRRAGRELQSGFRPDDPHAVAALIEATGTILSPTTGKELA